MNEIRTFENEQFGSIRTKMIDGEPWFVAKDVALALGYKNFRDAIKSTLMMKIRESQNATPLVECKVLQQ